MTFWGKFLNDYKLQKLEDVLVNLKFLADAEGRISDFYRLCADAMPEEAALWNHLADQESQHSEMVWRMHAMVTAEPKRFSPGMSFSTVSIRLFAVEMQSLVDRLKDGKIHPDELFAIALEIEDSVVELSYRKIVETKDEAFIALAQKLDTESAEHKTTLSSRMKIAR